MGLARWLLVLIAGTTIGCFSPRAPDNIFGCIDDELCPDHMRCSNKVCVAGADLRAGASHVCATAGDGTLWCWGNSLNGRLGDGLRETGVAATPVNGLPVGRLTHHTSGGLFSCAVVRTSVDEIWCWGHNAAHEVSAAGNDSEPNPQHVADFGEVSALESSASSSFACVIVAGQVWCWGQNLFGVLGRDPSATPNLTNPMGAPSTATPLKIGLPDMVVVVAVATGQLHACALTNDPNDNVWCWGHNDSGQLGQPKTPTPNPQPTLVPNLHASALAAGFGYTCAIDAQHAVRCWGVGSATGFGMDSRIPTSIALPAEVSAERIAAGNGSTCIVDRDGNVWCWGDNTWGVLGNATPIGGAPPVRVDLPGPASAITVGQDYACARVAGESYCWGIDEHGQLGDHRTDLAFAPEPVRLADGSPLDKIDSIQVGTTQTCAQRADGVAYCWGWNQDGQLGDGGTRHSSRPVRAPEYDHRTITSGGRVVCSMDTEGAIRCRGDNTYAQLGFVGPVDPSAPPTKIVFDGVPLLATKLAVGDTWACAIAGADARVVCWGKVGAFGEFVQPPKVIERLNGAALEPLTGATQLAIGHLHACAILSDQHAACWGSSALVLPSPSNHTEAFGLGLVPVDAVACGLDFTCALSMADVKCIGADNVGQLGNDGGDRTTLVSVAWNGPAAPTAISAGRYHACAIDAGSVRCWGDNTWAQAGTDPKTPALFAPGARVLDSVDTTIVAGLDHTCAIRTTSTEDHVVYCWGSDAFGGLGRGSILNVTPRRVTVLDAP